MENLRRVLLYGRSVILGTVGASLKQRSEFETISLTPPFPGVEELRGMKPDVILFDLGEGHPEAAFALLESCPGVLLVGVNPDCNEVRMWSGRNFYELSTQDLVQAILSSTSGFQNDREYEEVI